jgi:uncharacterized membrane protein YkvA (DUF1232 family)
MLDPTASTGDEPAPPPSAAEAAALRDGELGRSNLQELVAMLPDIARLVPALIADPRVPIRTKLIAGAAFSYVTVPIEPLPELVRGTGIGVDDLVAIGLAVRHLITGAGYEVVRERWTGTDAGLMFLLLFTGVDA